MVERNVVFLITGVVIFLVMMVYGFADMDVSKPWHPLKQIAKTSSDTTSIDQDANGRIDPGIIEDTLQDITNNGAETTNAITIGGLTVTGTSTFTGSATFNSDVILNSITNCQTDLITDANGKLTCSTQEDKDSTNELQTLYRSGSQICISDTGSCVTDNVNDADASTTNEKISDISLSLVNNNLELSITEGSSTYSDSVSLSSLISTPALAEVLNAGNDAQGNSITGLSSLSIGSATLSITSVANYGSLLSITGVNAIGINNAYIGSYNGLGTVRAQQFCINNDCKTSWSSSLPTLNVDCKWLYCNSYLSWCKITCPSGYYLMGGVYGVSETGETGFTVSAYGNTLDCAASYDSSIKCYARCCRFYLS